MTLASGAYILTAIVVLYGILRHFERDQKQATLQLRTATVRER
jgi:hypothetical protein